MVGGRGVIQMIMVDDLGGVGVQKRSFCDDVICEQPLISRNLFIWTIFRVLRSGASIMISLSSF